MTAQHPNPVTRQGGFTIIEMMIVMVVLAVMLAAVGNTANVVNTTVNSNDRSAEATSLARRTVRRIGAFIRPGKLSTVTVTAIDDDVKAGRATAVGEWISPTDNVWRPGLQFVAATGLLSMNAALSTSPRELTFQMEAGESDNGIDDDGDGIIDEGTVRLLHNGVTVTVVRDVELCEFALDQRVITVRLRCAKRQSGGLVHRATFEQSFYLRNN